MSAILPKMDCSNHPRTWMHMSDGFIFKKSKEPTDAGHLWFSSQIIGEWSKVYFLKVLFYLISRKIGFSIVVPKNLLARIIFGVNRPAHMYSKSVQMENFWLKNPLSSANSHL